MLKNFPGLYLVTAILECSFVISVGGSITSISLCKKYPPQLQKWAKDLNRHLTKEDT